MLLCLPAPNCLHVRYLVLLRFRGHLDSGLGLAPVRMTLSGDDSSIGGSEMSSQRYSPAFKDEAKDRKFYRDGEAGCVEDGR